MTKIDFHKYQGTGNDFIMIDDRERHFNTEQLDLIKALCNRKFGIGADGLILVRTHNEYDFEMVYFNPDGSQSLCGNGSRCAVKFAHELQMIDTQCTFLAVDGVHQGIIDQNIIRIQMGDVSKPEQVNDSYFINTGSPHHIELVSELSNYDVVHQGKQIRYSEQYKPGGTNVNFVQPVNGEIKVRTYERGVEAETLSCGTGVTAVALVMATHGHESPVIIQAMGGTLEVTFNKLDNGDYTNIYLCGPAAKVFEGSIEY